MRWIVLVAALGACGGSPAADPDAAGPADAAPTVPAFPLLAAHTGRVLSPMRLVTVVAGNDNLAADLIAFGDTLVQSAWWQAAAAPFGLGTATSVHYTGPAIPSDLTQAQMITYLQDAITAGAPAPDGKTLYLLYLPDGVKNAGPVPFGAYHAPFPAAGQGLGDGWAVVTRATPYGGGETALQATTRAASHEVMEAATDPGWSSWSLEAPPADPWNGTPWQVFQIPGPIETADLCTGSRTIDASGNEYQRYFSNDAAAAGGDPCLPAATHGEIYFNTRAEHDWTAVAASQTVTIPVTGWSAGGATVPDWLTIALVVQASPGFASLGDTLLPLSSPLGKELPACLGEGMNDNMSATVQVAVPAGVTSGDYLVIQIQSFRDNPATCYPYATGDQFHFWLTGVYVP